MSPYSSCYSGWASEPEGAWATVAAATVALVVEGHTAFDVAIAEVGEAATYRQPDSCTTESVGDFQAQTSLLLANFG